ncbi:MAG: hypothetical protein JWO56_284, partial [Acidobacteria bacterium]|nr:hypothetical protein [Acidobacteriota bacterium]
VWKIVSAKADPGRRIISALVSAARRLTLDQSIDAVDLFELTVEDSGAWLEKRGRMLEDRVAADEAIRLFVSRNCLRTDDIAWFAALDERPELLNESLLRVLILEARETVDRDALRTAALARLAIRVAEVPGIASPAIVYLRGCAGVELGNALRHLGEYTEALRVLEAAESDLDRDVMSAHALARCWYAGAAVRWKRGDLVSASGYARRAGLLFTLLGDAERTAHVDILEAGIAFESGDAAAARNVLLRALKPLTVLEDARGLASAWLSLGTAEAQLGNMTAAKVWFGKAAKAFTAKRVKPELARVWWSFGYYSALHEDRGKGLERMRAARQQFEALKMPGEAGFVSLDIAEVLLMDPADAHAAAVDCRHAHALFRAADLQRAAEKALAHLQDAAEKHHANARLVRAVRSYLTGLERQPDAVFDPETES